MVKKIIFILYILVLVCMAAATIVEKSQGTDYAHAHYYGAWWFILIWAVLAALGAFYIIKSEVRFYIGTPSLLHHHPCRGIAHTYIG